MAKTKSDPKKAAKEKTMMIKIAGQVGHLAGELVAGKDHLMEMASDAIESVKSTIHNITTKKKTTPKEAVKIKAKKIAQKEIIKARPKKAVPKTAQPVTKKAAKAAAAKKIAAPKKAIPKATKKAAVMK